MLLEWEKLAGELESQARTVRIGEGARILKDKVEETMSIAENGSAPTDIMDRLDLLLMNLTEKSRDNICTNTKCPHYNKKCRMR
jgi:hypothetical protein